MRTDADMSAWVQRGQVFLWRYPEGPSGYSGGHLTADGEGCRSMGELLTKFIDVPRNRSAIVRVSRPTSAILAVPNNRGGAARWAAPSELQIESKADGDPDAWHFKPKGERFELVAGAKKLQELRDAFRGIPSGKGDFAIGPEAGSPERHLWNEMCLWVWWMPSEPAA